MDCNNTVDIGDDHAVGGIYGVTEGVFAGVLEVGDSRLVPLEMAGLAEARAPFALAPKPSAPGKAGTAEAVETAADSRAERGRTGVTRIVFTLAGVAVRSGCAWIRTVRGLEDQETGKEKPAPKSARV